MPPVSRKRVLVIDKDSGTTCLARLGLSSLESALDDRAQQLFACCVHQWLAPTFVPRLWHPISIEMRPKHRIERSLVHL